MICNTYTHTYVLIKTTNLFVHITYLLLNSSTTGIHVHVQAAYVSRTKGHVYKYNNSFGRHFKFCIDFLKVWY